MQKTKQGSLSERSNGGFVPSRGFGAQASLFPRMSCSITRDYDYLQILSRFVGVAVVVGVFLKL